MSRSLSPVRWPASYYAYRVFTRLAAPLLRRTLRRKHVDMGGSHDRIGERFGQTSLQRPSGPLCWINAASLGELRAALPMIHASADHNFLVTTTSQSAADLAQRILPANAQHQFTPIDLSESLLSFLDHWHPDLAVFMESELPLRTIRELARRQIPMANVNARPSRTRRKLPKLARAVMAHMSFVTAQDTETAREITSLGVPQQDLVAICDLKALAPPPAADAVAVADLRRQIGDRPLWLAMSTHPEELPAIAAAHRLVLQRRPDTLLVIAPRHPENFDPKARDLDGFLIAQRSHGQALEQASVYVADTLGEAGTLFAVAPFALIGGTLCNLGGHSPQEALQSGRPVLFGPHPGHHSAPFHTAAKAGAALQVTEVRALARQVLEWLAPEGRRNAEEAAVSLVQSRSSELETIVDRLADLMPSVRTAGS